MSKDEVARGREAEAAFFQSLGSCSTQFQPPLSTLPLHVSFGGGFYCFPGATVRFFQSGGFEPLGFSWRQIEGLPAMAEYIWLQFRR